VRIVEIEDGARKVCTVVKQKIEMRFVLLIVELLNESIVLPWTGRYSEAIDFSVVCGADQLNPLAFRCTPFSITGCNRK
jgi:hypothetical protein